MGWVSPAMTVALAATASDKVLVKQFSKNPEEEQKMYHKESKNNPFHCFAFRMKQPVNPAESRLRFHQLAHRSTAWPCWFALALRLAIVLPSNDQLKGCTSPYGRSIS